MAILANLTISGQVLLTKMVQRHIYEPETFISVYNQASMTSRSNDLARTRLSLKKTAIFGNFGPLHNFRSSVYDRNGQKAHI